MPSKEHVTALTYNTISKNHTYHQQPPSLLYLLRKWCCQKIFFNTDFGPGNTVSFWNLKNLIFRLFWRNEKLTCPLPQDIVIMVGGRPYLAPNISNENSLGKCISLRMVLPEKHVFCKNAKYSQYKKIQQNVHKMKTCYAINCINGH